MLYSLLASGADPFRKVGGWEAALYALIGFAIVFAGLLFLILIVWGTGKIISSFENKGKKVEKKEPAKKETVAPVESAPQSAATDEIDEETVAIITAAIMAYYQKNNPKCEFTVKRIKRI